MAPPKVQTRLLTAAPISVPATPSVDNTTAAVTAPRALPIACVPLTPSPRCFSPAFSSAIPPRLVDGVRPTQNFRQVTVRGSRARLVYSVTFDHVPMAVRPSNARPRVTSSAYSRSPPTGNPLASFETGTPNG